MNKLNKMAAGAVSIALIASLAACGGGKSGSDGASSPGGDSSGKPMDISITTIAFSAAPTGELEGLKKIGEKFNVNLKINYIPANNITEKLNVLLASNDIPDVTFVEDFSTTPSFLNGIDKGAFWELTPYIKNYPNLSKYPQNVFDNASIKGKLYSLPRVRPLDGSEALILRKDWLDKLGLQPPKTMDELYNVLSAFAKNDPDGNGKADTYGLALFGSPGPAGYLISMFGAGTGWHQDADGITPNWMTPQAKEALQFWNKTFQAGGIVPDLPVMKSQQVRDMVVQGKAGAAITNVSDAYKFNLDLKKANPDANLMAFELPKASDGKAHYEQAIGYYGQFLVSKKVSEEKLKRILEVYDYTATEEGYNLGTYGIKDVDFTLASDGSVTQTEDGKKKGYSGDSTGQWVTGYYNKYLRAATAGIPSDVLDYNKKLIDTIAAVSEPNPEYGLPKSAAFKEKGADWNKKINDMIINVIIGKSSLDDWDKFVKTMKDDSGFQSHLKETNESYKAKASK
ncbi:extracellular solute-binding protein [Paenibacillus doosanensis]|uniref:Lipoprotein LipO n=1 Tax=Paenibacillus konkukensis TaxID=2020716 RepID=A0ABY4RQX2_9BACL|nr:MULTISPECIES: extracellular solute-binding protein [Paenibacillus]MCS7463230.1 extracellular solute-binding protein [Paenibacillus doosanensis]UQZ84882.1 Lipoprotein LipO precursor [Paenibacillus konkukensis]